MYVCCLYWRNKRWMNDISDKGSLDESSSSLQKRIFVLLCDKWCRRKSFSFTFVIRRARRANLTMLNLQQQPRPSHVDGCQTHCFCRWARRKCVGCLHSGCHRQLYSMLHRTHFSHRYLYVTIVRDAVLYGTIKSPKSLHEHLLQSSTSSWR